MEEESKAKRIIKGVLKPAKEYLNDPLPEGWIFESSADLTNVSREDIMGDGFGGEPASYGEEPQRKRTTRLVPPTPKLRPRPLTSMSGVKHR